MRIKKLELQGFKSFVDRQTFHFGSGIAGVVGPNGCGKSNVVDAVKWVIGEQSAKSLRGAHMQDVIFNGSAVRKKVGLAEVLITFARTEDKAFPGDYARFEEISVGRRLFRDGNSEYLINGIKVRRRDVVELLMDTGIGHKLYSFIEQGQIGQIVQARPEQRRGLIEEAAGIGKFKARKAEAEQKLEATAQNLERATDVAEEMRRRLRTLERQVEKAARHRRLQAQVRQGELFLGLVKYAALSGDRKALSHAHRTSMRDTEDTRRDLERRDQALQGQRDEIAVMSSVVGRQRDELAELEAQRREAESARRYQSREAEELRVRLDVLEHDLAEAGRRDVEASAEVERLDREVALARDGMEDRDSRLARLRAEADQARLAFGTTRRELENTKRDHMALVTSVVRRQATLQASERRVDELSRQLDDFLADRARVDTDLGAQTQALAEAEAEVQAVQLREEEARAAVDALRLQARDGQLAEERLRGELRRQERACTDAERAVARTEARLQSLQDLARRHAGVDSGVRKVLDQASTMGILAEHLDVPAELQELLESAAGGALEHILVRDTEQLAEAAELAVGKGRTGFVVVRGAIPEQGLASRIQGSDEGLAALGTVLGVCHEAPDLRAALLLHERTGERVLVPSMQARVEPNGVVLVGPETGGTGGAILERRRGIAKLESELTQVQAELTRLRAGVQEAQLAVEQGRDGLTRVLAEIEESRVAHRRVQDELGEARSLVRDRARELKAGEDRVRYLATEEGRLRARIHAAGEEQDKQRAAIETDQRRQAQVEADLTELQARLVRDESLSNQCEQELTRARSETSAAKERVALLSAGLASARTTRDEARARSKRASEERGRSRDRLRLLEGDDSRLNQLIQELGEKQGSLRDKLSADKTRLGRARQALSASEDSLRGLRDRLGLSQARVQKLELRLQETKLGIESLRGGLEPRYQLSLPGLLDRLDREAALVLPAGEQAQAALPAGLAQLEPVADLRVTPELLESETAVREWVARLEKVKAGLEKLGEVHLAALDEYSEVSERYAWLEQQRQDLEESVDTIRKAIGKINRTCRERFREAFDQVNGYFRQTYPRLVGGGQARLKLTNEDDLLETGVDIFVQPPGKRLQNLTLLSGGEKAMCAIALLFSLFRVKPSPFCILDEVDAPLDEGNGARFNSVLREMSELTQFIVITHNKKTMEVVDTLYGVTMPDPGISRLVTVKVG
jgi:chromosome segregation protein